MSSLPSRFLAGAVLCLLTGGIKLASAAPRVSCPPQGTTFPTGPFDFKVEPKKAMVRIELSQLPETRLIGVVEQLGNDSPDNNRPNPAALVWDPLEAPRLGYDLPLDKGLWRLSFRSDPLYRTAEASAGRTDSQRVSLSYRPVSEAAPDDVMKDCGAEFRPIPKAIVTQIDGWKAYPDYIRLQPFNLLEYVQKDVQVPSWSAHKQDVVVSVYWRRIVSGSDAENLRKLQVAKASREEAQQELDILKVRGSNLNPIEIERSQTLSLAISELEKTIKQLESGLGNDLPIANTVSSAINRMAVSEGRGVNGRSLADPIPQVVADLFSILAEIAFDRAKAKSFSILSERAIKLVCSELTGSVLRAELAKTTQGKPADWWWIPDSSLPLLPQTCDTVRGLRIQELATAGKVIYAALLADISAVPLMVLKESFQFEKIDLPISAVDDAIKVLGKAASLPGSADRLNTLSTLKQAALDISNGLSVLRDKGTSAEKKLDTLINLMALIGILNREGNRIDAPIQSLYAPLEAFQSRIRPGVSMVLLTAPLLRGLAVTVQRFAAGGSLDEREIQLAFLGFAKEFAKQSDALLPYSADKSLVCPVRLALAVVSECQSRGGCDAAGISSYLQNPEQFLSDEPCSKQDPKLWPAISVFISRAIELIRPTKSTPPAVQLHNTVELIFSVADFILSKHPDATFPFEKDSLAALRSIFLGAVDQEVQKVLVGLGSLIGRGLAQAAPQQKDTQFAKTLRKFSALAGAVASYAQSYPGSNEQLDEKQAKAQREARKKAIESMMELTTNRTERAGDFIVSIGINPGFALVGGQFGPGATGQSSLFYTQLTLPTGVALQWLSPRKGVANCVGGHMQFSVLDLAQFVSFDGNANLSMNNLRWADFVMAGLQAGVSIGCSPNTQFFVGADFRYAPTLSFAPKLPDDATPAAIAEQEQHRGVFRVGLTVGYYVPFFDFN